MKVFNLPNTELHELLDEEDEEDEDIDDDDLDSISEEDGNQEEVDAYGNPKESSSNLDKDLPAGPSVGLGSHSSKSERKKKTKNDISGVKVISVKLNKWFPLSGSEEEGEADASKGAKGNNVLLSSFLEHFMVSTCTVTWYCS